MSSFIGIDLGTTFSAVSTIDETGRPVIVHNSDGHNITPSCIEFSNGKAFVGEEAKKTFGMSPNSVSRFKRDMGESKTYDIEGNTYTPTDLSSILLKKLLKDTVDAIGDVGEAVVTIPANFTNKAREATMAAAKNAGLNVNYIVNEPTAAALYYAYQAGKDLNGNYAVYDLGGGTFDISIIRVNGHDVDVIRSAGVNKLGGDDFDNKLRELIIKKAKTLYNEDINDDYTTNEAEEEKISLSKRDEVSGNLKSIRKALKISRDEYEEAISSLLMQTQMLCEAVVDEAGLTMDQIESVFLVGGSTRIPAVREIVKQVFKQDPISTANVDEVVALGASLYAAYKGNQEILNPVQKKAISNINVGEQTSQNFGTIIINKNVSGDFVEENSIIIERGEKIPCSVTKPYYTMHDGQKIVDCSVTQSVTNETDPKFVEIIWKGDLELGPDTKANQEVKVTFGFDDNQVMYCSFLDTVSGKKIDIELDSVHAAKGDNVDIESVLIE